MRRAFAAVLAIGVLMVFPTAPAAAHGDKIKLDLAGDGASGVTVRALYEDGHPVDDKILRLVLTATGDGGRLAGPMQLNPTTEGRGFYTSGAVLAPGRWTVVVTAPAPNATRAEATVDARPQQTAPPPAAADPADAGRTDRDGGRTWWIVGLLAAVGITGGGLLFAVRRRSTTPTRVP
jgi:hypothetical protein